MPLPRPIFIIGKHRSGTSWLGNLLAEHSEIYGVQNPNRHGIWESLYFTHVAETFRNVDTSTKAGFSRWAAYMGRTNYVRFSAVDAEELGTLGPAPFPDLFQRLMDRAAQNRQKSVWIEKSPPHTLVATQIANFYPNARFVAVSRTFDDWLRSSVKHARKIGRSSADHGLARAYLIAKLVGERCLYDAAIARLDRKSVV